MEDVKVVVQRILSQMNWGEVINLVPGGPQKRWLFDDVGTEPEDEKRLHPDVSKAVRNLAAYQYTLFDAEARFKNQPDVIGRYQILLTNAVRNLTRACHQHTIAPRHPERKKNWVGWGAKDTDVEDTPSPKGERVAPGATRAASQRKEKHMTEQVGNVAKKAEKAPPAKGKGKGAAPAANTQGKANVGAGGRFKKDTVSAVLKETVTNPAAICKAAKESFGVAIKPADLASAPNGGVMKMRAGNMIRNVLKAEGRLSE